MEIIPDSGKYIFRHVFLFYLRKILKEFRNIDRHIFLWFTKLIKWNLTFILKNIGIQQI